MTSGFRSGAAAPTPTTLAEFQFSTLSQTDEGQRETFFRRMFPSRADFLIRHWRWVYRIGYGHGIDPPVLIRYGLMIGHGGAIPTELAFRGERRLALWYVDLALLPEFQGTGLGKRLTTVWMQLCPNQLGFNANSKSAVVLRRLGWEPGPYARRCALPINIDRMMASRPGFVVSVAAKAATVPYRLALRLWVRSAPDLAPEPIPEDHGELGRLFEAPSGVELKIVRDAQWIQWRILDSPFYDSYRLFRMAESAALVRGVVWNGQRRLHILFVDRKADAKLNKELLRGIIKWALGHGVDLVWTVVNGRALLAELRSLLPSHAPVCFVASCDDGALLAALRGPDYEMHGVDCDSDVMYVPDHGSSVRW